jgi:hypothetical protein
MRLRLPSFRWENWEAQGGERGEGQKKIFSMTKKKKKKKSFPFVIGKQATLSAREKNAALCVRSCRLLSRCLTSREAEKRKKEEKKTFFFFFHAKK